MADSPPVSWIGAAAGALRRALNSAEAQSEIKNLEDAAARLPELIEVFRTIAEAAEVVRLQGWDGRSANPDVRTALRQAVESLDNRPVNTALIGYERFRSDVTADLTQFWRQYASERLGNVGELQALAGTLSAVDGLAGLSTKLEAVLGELARSQDKLPSTRSAELLSDAESALEQLEKSLRPDSVRRFLSAVARGGAPIESLTDDVTGWLASHNALHGFKIVAGAPIEITDE